eukprot:2025987-Amphidinium_carterae.1
MHYVVTIAGSTFLHRKPSSWKMMRKKYGASIVESSTLQSVRNRTATATKTEEQTDHLELHYRPDCFMIRKHRAMMWKSVPSE